MFTRFNPYSSGLAVMTTESNLVNLAESRFNPYSSGLAVMTFFF